jgi:hypothetical protein
MSKKTEPDNLLILKEVNIKNEMKKYAQAHEQEAIKNYGYCKNTDFKNLDMKQQLAGHIHKKYNKMSLEEMKNIVIRCMTKNQIKRILLEFELKYYEEIPKKITLKKFTILAKKILDRYQCKGGGYYIEDMDWEIHTYTSENYDIKENQVLFVNSIDKMDKDDNETIAYMKRITKRINGLSEDIDVEYEFHDPEEDGINWIEIWCTDKTKEDEIPEISL